MKRFSGLEVERSETERAYAAGLIDGEGCIRVTRSHQRSKGPDVILHFVEVMLTTSTPIMAEWLCDRWGGAVTYNQKSVGYSGIIMCRWRVGSLRATKFLEDIYPYLTLKKEQAMYARAFQALATMHKGYDMTPEWMALKDRLHMIVRNLKKDGKTAARAA